jgi:autoinducer 2-degrading protein
MPKALIVEFQLLPQFIEAFSVAIAHNAKASLAQEPGCQQFDVCRDPNDASLFFLYEMYNDDDAIAQHLATPHFRAFDAQVREWIAKRTVRRLTRVVP